MTANTNRIKSLLQELTSVKILKDILNTIGFNIISGSKIKVKEDGTESIDADANLIGQHGEFLAIFIKINSEKLTLSDERRLIKQIKRQYPHSFFIFSDSSENIWHFVNAKTIETAEPGREASDRWKKLDSKHIAQRITIGPEEREYGRLRTAAERLALITLPEKELPPLELQKLLDNAFDVEKVTEEFYKQYHDIFEGIVQDLRAQTGNNSKWAHDFALQLLNRILLLHFIQKKRWLGDDPDFMNSFWRAYNSSSQPKDSFYCKWLEVMFFSAFNNNWQNRFPHFPENIRKVLSTAPYLNGGLFTENELDKKNKNNFNISDSRWKEIYEFFNSYNFTISEDTPLDREVAVDPEMIGHVYESLVNLSEYEERRKAGIFYTPQTEIELMCRLSLSDYLVNHLGESHRNLILEFVFAIDDEEKNAADEQLQNANLARQIDDLLKNVTVLDPACGSGSFLVGMLTVLFDLSKRTGKKILGDNETDYERKKRIIRESLYGVDIMKWAVDIAELRLWLQLLIDTKLSEGERHFKPLLPNLDFKLRVGDSLVQEVGGYNLSHYRRKLSNLPPNIKGKITAIKGEKRRFYNSEIDNKSEKVDQLKNEEAALFRMILDNRINEIERKIRENEKQIETENENMYSEQGKFTNKEKTEKLSKEIKEYIPVLDQLKTAHKAILSTRNIPFVWDIAFIEIFEDEKNGFDIVIGNPPYVRQEKITAPEMPDGSRITSDKKEYKAKLMKAVYSAYPKYFGYNLSKDKSLKKIDAKSDLYIYFYFMSLSLLNPKGSFCFITSNSWLDVGYGVDLQEFLIKTGTIKLVLDNKVKRSFKHADINTIITLFGKPYEKQDKDFENYARFVMFEIPFEGAFSPVIFEEIFDCKEKKRLAEYRIFPKRYSDLLIEGVEFETDEKEEDKEGLNLGFSSGVAIGPLIKTTKYIGNKWGGKYLRAPDIYWTILEKGKGKLVRLGDIAKVRRGITTGANDFFYLKPLGPADKNGLLPVRNGAGWEGEIEEKFLKPVIISPRDSIKVNIDSYEMDLKLLSCNCDLQLIKDKLIHKYIKWGEDHNYHIRPSCKNRKYWYELPIRNWSKVLWPMIHNDRHCVFWNEQRIFIDHNLFEVFDYDEDILWGSLYWSGQILIKELFGRVNLGQGALKTEGVDIRSFLTFMVNKDLKIIIENYRKKISDFKIESVFDDVRNKDKINFDDIFFSTLNFTDGEKQAVYEAIIQLLTTRLKKADSLIV